MLTLCLLILYQYRFQTVWNPKRETRTQDRHYKCRFIKYIMPSNSGSHESGGGQGVGVGNGDGGGGGSGPPIPGVQPPYPRPIFSSQSRPLFFPIFCIRVPPPKIRIFAPPPPLPFFVKSPPTPDPLTPRLRPPVLPHMKESQRFYIAS